VVRIGISAKKKDFITWWKFERERKGKNMDMNPTGGKGFLTWAITGFVGAMVALLVGYFLPSVVPTKASASRL
jgi:hypothetical protein